MLAYMRLEANNYRWRFEIWSQAEEVRRTSTISIPSSQQDQPALEGGRVDTPTTNTSRHEEGGYTLRFTGLVKYDNETGKSWRCNYGAGVLRAKLCIPKVGATSEY